MHTKVSKNSLNLVYTTYCYLVEGFISRSHCLHTVWTLLVSYCRRLSSVCTQCALWINGMS